MSKEKVPGSAFGPKPNEPDKADAQFPDCIYPTNCVYAPPEYFEQLLTLRPSDPEEAPYPQRHQTAPAQSDADTAGQGPSECPPHTKGKP